jgi:hypothetical protein
VSKHLPSSHNLSKQSLSTSSIHPPPSSIQKTLSVQSSEKSHAKSSFNLSTSEVNEDVKSMKEPISDISVILTN